MMLSPIIIRSATSRGDDVEVSDSRGRVTQPRCIDRTCSRLCSGVQTPSILLGHGTGSGQGGFRLFSNDVLGLIGARHGRTIAQVVLRWLHRRGIVSIPKSVRKERMAENFAIFDFELDDDDLARTATLDQKASSFFDHRDPAMVELISNRTL